MKVIRLRASTGALSTLAAREHAPLHQHAGDSRGEELPVSPSAPV